MAKMQLIVELSPELNKGEMMNAAKAVRAALGESVKGVSFADTAKGAKETAEGLQDIATNAVRAQDAGKGFASAFAFNQVLQSVQAVSGALSEVIGVANEFESTLAAVGAITGFSGDALSEIGDKARDLAKQFGGSASEQLKSFQGILSKLGPQVAENADALALFGRNVSILSAASGDDAATSMSAITDSMLQFGLVTGDSMKDAQASTDVINALAASAKVGAAEVPQVTQSILQAGVAAKGAKMSFEETTAAIQTLSLGGKTGSEAGVALRNVLGMLQKASGPAEEAMRRLGTSSEEMGKALTEKGFDVALGQLKEGLDGVGSAAERNALLMQIFGTENASAAGILLDNLDKYAEFSEGIKQGQEGVGSAFEQANQRMDTADGMMSRLTSSMQDLFITAGQTLGSTASAFLGFANSVAPSVTALSGLANVIPTKQIGQMALTLLSKLVPSLVMSDVATKSLVFNKSALSLANIKEAATNAASIAGKYAHAAATWTLTAAQNALNAAMSLNPIGLVVIGIAAAAAAVYLLYQNFEVVRNAVDAVFSAIGTAAEYIGNVFSGIGSAVSAIFGDSGRSAGEAFTQGFAEAKLASEIEDTSKNLSEKLSEGAKIKLKLDAEQSLPAIVEEYEKIQSKLSELRLKQSGGSLTAEELEEFKKLEKAAESASQKIQAIAPETKGAARSVVDEMGNLRLVYDLNISKAKEFAKAGAASGELKKAAKEYSTELEKQAKNIENQIYLNNQNLAAIERTANDEVKRKLIEKYNEENAAIEKNRLALVASLTEGAKAGLVTSEAIDRLAKTLGMSSEEARKMLVAKALDEASKSGKVTEEQVKKIAEKYSFSKDKAIELLEEQRKNTAEAEATANAAKDIGAAYDENKKSLEDKYKLHIRELNALKLKKQEAGGLSESEQARFKQLESWLVWEADQLKGIDKIEKESADKFKTSYENKKKAAESGESAYQIAKKEYEESKRTADLERQKLELKEKETRLDSGRLETALEKRNRQLEILRSENKELETQKLKTKELSDAAAKERDPKKRAQYLAEIEKLKTQLDLDIQKNVVSQKEIIFDANLDDAKLREEISKINADSEKSKIKFDIEFGREKASKLIEFELAELQKQIETNQSKLSAELALGASGDAKSIEEYKSAIAAANREIYSQTLELNNQLERERIAGIADASQRAMLTRIADAKEAYSKDLAMSGANEQSKLEALVKYQSAKLSAEQDYLRSKSGIYAALDNVSEGFKSMDLSGTKKNVEQEIKAVEEGRKKLEESFQKREITTAEYLRRDRELTAESEKLKNEQSSVNWSAATAALADALQKQADAEIAGLQDKQAKLQALRQNEILLAESLEKAKTDLLRAELEGREDLIAEHTKKVEDIKKAQFANEKETAEASSSVWLDSMNAMGTQFAAFAVQSGKIGQSLAKSLFSTAKAMVPTFVVMILGKSIESLGPILGPIVSGGLTATLYGLLAVAQSALGFKSGGYTGDGNPDEIAGIVHKGEYVMPARTTALNRRAFSEIDKGGLTVEAWYEANNSDKIAKQVQKEARLLVAQANIASQASAQVADGLKMLSGAIEGNTRKIEELTGEVKKGNYSRKSKVEYDLNVRLDKDKMIKEVEMSNYKNMKRL